MAGFLLFKFRVLFHLYCSCARSQKMLCMNDADTKKSYPIVNETSLCCVQVDISLVEVEER